MAQYLPVLVLRGNLIHPSCERDLTDDTDTKRQIQWVISTMPKLVSVSAELTQPSQPTQPSHPEDVIVLDSSPGSPSDVPPQSIFPRRH